MIPRTWRAGDPIGGGALFFPSKAARSKYAKKCRDEIIDGMARKAVGLATLAQRRAFIDACPEHLQGALKARLRQMWGSREKEDKT